MSYITRAADTTKQEQALRKVEKLAKALKVNVGSGTKIGKYPQTVILDHRYQGSEIYVDSDCKIEIQGEVVSSIQEIKEALLKLKS